MSPPKFLFCLILILICFVVPHKTASILAYFPIPSISHQVVFRPLTQELARRGHEVTVITPDPSFAKNSSPENLTEIDIHDMSYEYWRKYFVSNMDGKSKSGIDAVKVGLTAITRIFEEQIKTKEVQDVLKSKKRFDILLVEACVRPATVLFHIFEAPLVQVSSFGAFYPNYQVIGAPTHPLLFPEITQRKVYNLSIWEKIICVYEDLKLKYLQWLIEEEENEMLKRLFGNDTPTVRELNNNVEMLFLNLNPIFEGNRPVPPGVIHMGGLHQKPAEALPPELQAYLDKSVNGVIYMSFGTNVDPTLLPSEKIALFNKVFTKLGFDVIWKWNKDVMPAKSKNVKLTKWVPQSDLLRHPNVKLFITQGGLQSTDEAITAGVPLIGFPILGDQWYNVDKYLHFNIGLKLDLMDLTEDVLEKSIKEVIGDPRYRRNIANLGRLMRDQPQQPLERAVWWLEYVIRHGGAKHLRSPLANISWTDYLMLDVFGVLVLTGVFALTILAYFIKYIIILLPVTNKKLSKID